MSKILRFLLCLFVVNQGLTTEASPQLDYGKLEKSLKRYEQKIKNLRGAIDNSAFNSEDILINQDFDALQLIKFVQDKIVFQAYSGLLRGIQGTLNSRAGNALDQSVLLAKLLNDAGFEARVMTGILSEHQSLLLLKTIKQAKAANSIEETDAFKNAMAAFVKQSVTSKPPVNWQKSQTFKRYNQALQSLESLFKQNTISTDKKDITEKLITENKDYFWVEYRNNPTSAWQQAHPAFAAAKEMKIKATAHFKDHVPKKYQHQLRIEAFIQQRVGDKYKTLSLMKPWQRPVVNLQNVLISYSNAPSGVNYKSNYDLTEILNKTHYFIPNFNGNPVGGKVFDLKGRLIDSEAMSSQMGGFFQTMGDKTLLATDALGEKKGGKGSLQLTAQWLQFTFIQPDGSEFIQKRYLYQAKKNKIENALSIKTKLLSEYNLVVNTGEMPLSQLADSYLDLVVQGFPLLEASTRKVFKGEEKTAFPKKLPRSAFELLVQYQWMQQNPNISADTIHYKANTNMLGFKRGFIDLNKAYLAVDIINNKQRYLHIQQDKIFADIRAAMTAGIWETASEWLPSKLLKLPTQEIDTLRVIHAAQQQNIDLQVLQNKAALKDMFVKNPQMQQRIKSDIDNGYWVITPKQTPKDVLMSGWWRFNPNTGETLGMTADGGGQELTEYMIEQTQLALMLVRSIGNLKKCTDDNSLNTYEKMCCLAEAHFNNVGGYAFGNALAGSVGTAGAALFDIGDFAHELATGTGIAPSTNGSICAAVGPIPDF